MMMAETANVAGKEWLFINRRRKRKMANQGTHEEIAAERLQGAPFVSGSFFPFMTVPLLFSFSFVG